MGFLKRNTLVFRLYLGFFLLSLSICTGTIGYHLVEEFTVLESLYMTVITLSTVGFQEIRPLSDDGRLFTIFLIIGNLGIFTYTLSAITQLFMNGELRDLHQKQRLLKRIRKMKNHTIVCGLGRNGLQACKELHAHNIPFVVVEKEDLEKDHFDFKIQQIQGDARQDITLDQAGIKNATALITTLPDDASNVFVVITARFINPELTIISRATSDSAEQKLRRAGANHVIMPDKVGGAHMANLVTKPDVVEFIDLISGQRGQGFQIAELSFDLVNERFLHSTIAELDIRGKTGANIIGFKTQNGEFVINPQADQKMAKHCKLIVLGTTDQVESLEKYYYS